VSPQSPHPWGNVPFISVSSTGVSQCYCIAVILLQLYIYSLMFGNEVVLDIESNIENINHE
jgi:hypothetical protein